MIYNYERVLRQVTYSNKKPTYYLNRQVRITCSELNGRFVSNEYIQTVSPKPNTLPFRLRNLRAKICTPKFVRENAQKLARQKFHDRKPSKQNSSNPCCWITWSELNGRIVSNEYIQTVSPNPKKFGISMKKGFIVHSPWYLPPSELVDFT